MSNTQVIEIGNTLLNDYTTGFELLQDYLKKKVINLEIHFDGTYDYTFKRTIRRDVKTLQVYKYKYGWSIIEKKWVGNNIVTDRHESFIYDNKVKMPDHLSVAIRRFLSK